MPYYVLLVLALLLIWEAQRARRAKIAAQHYINNKKHRREFTNMKKLAERFVGKDCLIYTVTGDSSPIKGVITELSDSGLIVENGGNAQAVNLEYVTRIQEWPKNSKGKKKNIIV